MSTPSDQPPSWQSPADSASQGAPATPGPSAKRRRPWGWIAACVLLLLVAGGIAIWALGLQSDLDDQKAQTAQAQQQAEQANDAVGALAADVDDISQSVNDAGDRLSQAGENVQEALDELRSRLESLRDELSQAAEDSGAADASPTP